MNHLMIPGIAVPALLLLLDCRVRDWWSVGLVTLTVSAFWQIALTRIRFADGMFCRGVRIVNAKGLQIHPISQPAWWQSILRAVILGAVVALPAGIAFSIAEALLSRGSSGLPPDWLAGCCLLPSLVLLLSIMLHRKGQGFHDLVARTAVVPADKDKCGLPRPDLWRPCW
ncbi:hypothetical protein [Candidatus Poriferisodalis sp.]|uniref:hypothetical protein n=1 Tax=Candidatus Poriferisodalis sp. TaxID=3101277 RepID=UPI003B52AD4E